VRCYRDAGDIARAIDVGEQALARLARPPALAPAGPAALVSTLAGAYAERGDLLRAAALLDELSRRGVAVDRSGMNGTIAEVYPAAALCRWIGRRCLYKGRAPRDDRSELLSELLAGLGDTFAMDVELRAQCAGSDHAFDAFVSALVARAVERGKTDRPRKRQRELACREGWIHVPAEGSLASLS
jgi:hypothetical protein